LVQTDEERKAYQKKYRASPKGKAKRKESRARPENKAKDKARKQTPEYKAQQKAYKQTPEVKTKTKELMKKYRARPENIAKDKARRQTPEYKAVDKKHKQTPEYKKWAKKHAKEYNSRPEVKAMYWEIRNTPESLANAKNDRNTNRLKILKHYSKLHSNSNIPCCNCCGENFHVDFLALDHIAGKRQMDLEPELKKLKYSSKLKGMNLHRWIIHNNFPDGFQILCTNCNFAKGMKKNNNQCPHEKMRKEEAFAMMEEQSSFEV